jgi:hypothetical protein
MVTNTGVFLGGMRENYGNSFRIICDLADIHFAKCHPEIMLRIRKMF